MSVFPSRVSFGLCLFALAAVLPLSPLFGQLDSPAPPAGWIGFETTHAQVAIDSSSKQFNGFAWAGNLGFVHFNSPTGAYGLGVLLTLLDIPTLGEWGMMLLTLLLGAAALRQMRKMKPGGGMAVS